VLPAGIALLGSSLTGVSFGLGTVNVLERGYNRFRTGANTAETVLTPANVQSSANQFHKQFVMRVDGKIEGSPLYASTVSIAGGTHNVLYVATMHNTVFAFDADTGAQLSARWLGNPVTGGDLHNLKPATIHSEWGILSTPIIDSASGTLYVVRWGYENGINGPTFRLFGLNVSDLNNDKFGSVLLDGFNVGGTGFDRFRQLQRAGLALVSKPGGAQAVVIAFGGGEGQGSAAGWVVALDTFKLAHGGAPANAWCSNPQNNAGSGGGGGVWMANAAPAVDANGDIYVVTGNGPYNPQFALDQLGESVVRLTWNPGNPGSLSVSDWFTPFLDADRDDAHRDQDLASGGVIALPDEAGLIVGGKDGVYYHVSRSDMGKRDLTSIKLHRPTRSPSVMPPEVVRPISMERAFTSTTCFLCKARTTKFVSSPGTPATLASARLRAALPPPRGGHRRPEACQAVSFHCLPTEHRTGSCGPTKPLGMFRMIPTPTKTPRRTSCGHTMPRRWGAACFRPSGTAKRSPTIGLARQRSLLRRL
jgi:hypothetical protein